MLVSQHLYIEGRPWSHLHLAYLGLSKMVDVLETTFSSTFSQMYIYTPGFNGVERGYTGFTLSIRPSVDRIVSAL